MMTNETTNLKAPTQFTNRPTGAHGVTRHTAPGARGGGAPERTPTLLLVLALAVAFPLLAAAQQSGTVVEDFSYVLGAGAWPGPAIAVAPNGAVYSAGVGFDDPSYTSRGLILATANNGNTWTAPLFVDSVPGFEVLYSGIAADSAGHLYVSGWSDDDYGNTTSPWLVKRSSDGGVTWTTVDAYTDGTNGAEALGLTVDAAGNVFVMGGVGCSFGNCIDSSWVIRRGIGGANFTTVDQVSGTSYNATGIFTSPTGIFVVGYGLIPSGRSLVDAWIVRRSTDGGNTWSTVDTFQYPSGYASFANGGGIDSHGNVYVVGEGLVVSGNGRRATSKNHWLVRKSSNGGSTWATVDDFASSSGSSVAAAFAADSSGNLFVVGTSSNTGAGGYWTVRKNPGGIGTWQTVDISQFDRATPGSIAANATGNVFVAGAGSVNGVSHWLIKRY